MSAIIDEIKKREDFKIGGKHVKLISKKFVIRTHTGTPAVIETLSIAKISKSHSRQSSTNTATS